MPTIEHPGPASVRASSAEVRGFNLQFKLGSTAPTSMIDAGAQRNDLPGPEAPTPRLSQALQSTRNAYDLSDPDGTVLVWRVSMARRGVTEPLAKASAVWRGGGAAVGG